MLALLRIVVIMPNACPSIYQSTSIHFESRPRRKTKQNPIRPAVNIMTWSGRREHYTRVRLGLYYYYVLGNHNTITSTRFFHLMSRTSFRHQKLLGFMLISIQQHTDGHRCNKRYNTPLNMICNITFL